MEILSRAIEPRLKALIGQNKVLLILGTRRVGKTVLINKLVKEYGAPAIILNGEDLDTQELLQRRSIVHYQRIVGASKLLVVDEAQAVPEIGKILKLMIDSQPELTIVATGSSSFDLLNKAGEPLTGRKIQFRLYPIAQIELKARETLMETRQHLEERLVFGSYPEVLTLPSYREKEDYLYELVQSYLLKDILAFEGIRQADKISKLLRLVAFQIGNEVSYNELGNQLGISKNTVENYLDLLNKVFLIYRLPAYSTNQRKEVSKGSKWYFTDNGIRNAIISDMRLLSMRQDIGSLWENYLITERIKRNTYLNEHTQYYFWRNYNQQEVDLIELSDGKLHAYEFKYNGKKKVKIPMAFSTAYPEATYTCVTKENYLDWIGG